MPWFSHIMPLKLLGLSLSLNSVFVLLHLLISETGCTEQVVDEEQGWHRTQFSICHQPSVHSLESPLDSKEIKQINPKGNQHNIYWKDWCWNWSSTTSTTWCKEPTHWKRPWCWAKLKVGGEGMTEDEMVGWHRWLNGHEFEQALGDGEGQGSLVCYSPWGCKESDTTEWLWDRTTTICAFLGRLDSVSRSTLYKWLWNWGTSRLLSKSETVWVVVKNHYLG